MTTDQSPIPDTKLLRAGKLTAKTVRSLSKVMRPGPHEIEAMVQSICIRKKWSRGLLAAMMEVNQMDLRAWTIGKRKPPGVALRLIWHLYMMDTAPAKAFSILHAAMWGKVDARPPLIVHRVEKEDRRKIIEELQSRRKIWDHTRFTANKLAERLGVSLQTARCIAKQAQYKLRDERTRPKKKFPPYLKPESIYLHLDWGKSMKELSRDSNVSIRSLAITRLKLLKIPKATLKRHLHNCGIDPKNFEAILRGHKRAPKTPKDFERNPLPRKYLPDNISTDEAKLVNLQAEENQTGQSADVRSEQEECSVSQPQEEIRGADAGNQ